MHSAYIEGLRYCAMCGQHGFFFSHIFFFSVCVCVTSKTVHKQIKLVQTLTLCRANREWRQSTIDSFSGRNLEREMNKISKKKRRELKEKQQIRKRWKREHNIVQCERWRWVGRNWAQLRNDSFCINSRACLDRHMCILFVFLFFSFHLSYSQFISQYTWETCGLIQIALLSLLSRFRGRTHTHTAPCASHPMLAFALLCVRAHVCGSACTS